MVRIEDLWAASHRPTPDTRLYFTGTEATSRLSEALLATGEEKTQLLAKAQEADNRFALEPVRTLLEEIIVEAYAEGSTSGRR